MLVSLASSSTACAAGTPPFLETFGSASQPSFLRPVGLAFDQSNDDLLVIDVEAKTISRYNSDGTPSNFSALDTNVVDGAGGADKVIPQENLDFNFGNPREVQIAIDESGGASDGNIYVTQPEVAPEDRGVIDIFDEDGTFLGQLTEYAEGGVKKFGKVCGVAVDSSGAVYVGDLGNGQIHKYLPVGSLPVNGSNSANFPFLASTLAAGTGPTAGFIFARKEFESDLTKLNSASGAEEYVVDADETVTVTVDPGSGRVFTSTTFNSIDSRVKEYDASGPIPSPPRSELSVASEVTGIAVDENTGNLYVARSGNTQIEVFGPAPIVPEALTEAATTVGPTSATLDGSVNPNGEPLLECFFEYVTKEQFDESGYDDALSAACEDPNAAEVGNDSTPVAVHADVSNLNPGTVYVFRLVATNANNPPGEPSRGEDGEFQTLGPSVKAGAASQITATGARVSAQINPNGEATTFLVEYVSDAQFDLTGYDEAIVVPASPRSAGSGSAFIEFFQQLSGLSPETGYHFRFVATNAEGTNLGADREFSTLSPTAGNLPDGRAYELVSPPRKIGEVFPREPDSSYGSCKDCLPGRNNQITPMQSAPEGNSVIYQGQSFAANLPAGPNEYLSNRSASGWGTASLSPLLSSSSFGQGYMAFSEDFSRGVLYQVDPPLTPQAPSRGGVGFANLYLREAGGSLEPLVTVEPPQRNPGFQEDQFRIRYAGANAGAGLTPVFTHLIFEANDALTEEVAGVAPEAPEVDPDQECAFPEADCNLYEWMGGELRLINVLPDETAATEGAVIGSGRLLGDSQGPPNVDHAISADGSRIFWSEEASGQVYVRVNGEETLEIPGPGLCKESVPLKDRACFLTASADGSRVLLSDGGLYEFDEGTEAYEEIADLTEGEEGFLGILGASEGLSRIYFVDSEELAGDAEEGKPNLYAWDEGAGTFIGVLNGGDNGTGELSRFGAWRAARSARLSQVSPDGRFLAFTSQARLTAYDNQLKGGGGCKGTASGCLEVFLYDATEEELTCASCNPSGEQPLGPSNLSVSRGLESFPPFPQANNLSPQGEGRLFFESQDALSQRDTNGNVQDVYEWEPEGVGSCEREGGCVFLITSGHAADDSMFMDASANGDDAFILTREQLLPADQNDQLDLYDARVGGGFEEGGIAPCEGEACAGPIAPAPQQPSAGSNEFIGPGNPPASSKPHCKKGFVKKHGKCVKKKPKKHKPKRRSSK